MDNRRTVERGSALIMALVVILLLLTLGATFLSVSVTDRGIAANEADAERAFQLAQAGLEDAQSILPATNLDTTLASGGSLFASTALAGGTYSVTVTNNLGPRFPTSLAGLDAGGATDDTDRIVLLTSTGRFRKGQRAIEVLAVIPQSDFRYAFWADTKLTISGSGFTDAYNSSGGSYDPGTATDDGDSFCNGTFNLSGSSEIRGDAATSGASPPDDDHVSGTTSANAPAQTILPVACPGTYTPAADIPTGSGITYDAAAGSLTVSGGNNVTLGVPPTTYSFSEITLSGGSTLTIVTGGVHVDVYVSGKLDISGGGLVNTGAKPPELTLYACGGGTEDWKLTGGSGAYFAVHAPTRKVTLSGGSELYGAIIGSEINNSGGSRMHYDQALAGGGVATFVTGSWRELFL